MKLICSILPRGERLIREAKRRGYLPIEEVHPHEGFILVAVACRYCRAPFEPYARSRQREHAAGHRRGRG
jgi:hypothetical protein